MSLGLRQQRVRGPRASSGAGRGTPAPQRGTAALSDSATHPLGSMSLGLGQNEGWAAEDSEQGTVALVARARHPHAARRKLRVQWDRPLSRGGGEARQSIASQCLQRMWCARSRL